MYSPRKSYHFQNTIFLALSEIIFYFPAVEIAIERKFSLSLGATMCRSKANLISVPSKAVTGRYANPSLLLTGTH